jgi:di/tricarboxylate transporter
VPIFMSLADRLDFDEGSNGRTALALAVGAGTLYPGFAILPSAIPNLVLMSAAESIHGIAPTYGRYFLLQFPVIGLVSIIALPLILGALFPDSPRHQASIAKPGAMNLDERKIVLLLIGALALWASDFAHGISPAWIALGAGLLCLTPGIGVLPPSAIVNKINLAPWIFIAGVVSLSAAVSASGLGDLVGRQLFAMVKLEPGHDALNFAAVSAMGMVIGLITTVPGEPAIMSAFAGNIAAATGWPLDTVLMAQVISWTMAPFPYALPPLVIAAQLAGTRASDLLRLLLAMTALAWIVMLPLQYLWWRALDMFA